MSSVFKGRAPAGIRVVFDGQSLCNVPVAPHNMPTFLMNNRFIPWVNVAISGHGWLDLTPSAETRLFPYARNRAGCTDILVMCGGQGDLFNAAPDGQQTGAVAYARAIDYANAARSAGFDYVLITTMSAVGPDVLGTGRPSPSELQGMVDYNVLVLANSGGFDAVADISVSPLDDATNTDFYHIDRTHYVAEGAKAAAELIAPALDNLLGSV